MNTKIVVALFACAFLTVGAVVQPMLSCHSIQDGRALAPSGFETCKPDVAACVKKINKGSKRETHVCDRDHKCRADKKHVSDDEYDYYCCYSDKCNSAASLGAGLIAVSAVTIKMIFL
ncbi:unnamed protein product [Bursaphelenchus xylophilus]|uniref:(pine wood nematode) hypothetical protein n=1 Tax=Bursaphelenchus xylophilus TaxID=6326 RepID=A0A1I7RP17_BURXY|nr:unnamed protein product [Bursaphelenchus xylophilus]CAG9124457.1 unnamed protein product [Bursaphelenchus xylophilus]